MKMFEKCDVPYRQSIINENECTKIRPTYFGKLNALYFEYIDPFFQTTAKFFSQASFEKTYKLEEKTV